jgi:RNA polymerase sigma-70 factor (ECF subfamily)
LRTYRDEHDFVVSVVRRLGVPPSDVEDAVQDVFVVLHRRLPELETRAALRFWLRSVAFRVCANHRRWLSVHWRRGRGEPIDPDSLYDVIHRPPDEARLLSEAREALGRALAKLDAEKQEVFVLTELGERTAGEIAVLTRTSPNTVASRLRAARKRIADTVRAGRRPPFRA